MAKINVKAALMKTVATGGGAVAAASLNKIDLVSKQSPLIRGIIKIAAGVILPGIAKGKSAGILSDVGNGMIAVGATELANATLFKNKPVSISGGIWPELGAMPYYPPVAVDISAADEYDKSEY